MNRIYEKIKSLFWKRAKGLYFFAIEKRYANLKNDMDIRLYTGSDKLAFARAVVLSAALHVVALVVAVVIVGLLVRTDAEPLPEAIEFIFMPAEEALPEARQSAAQPEQAKRSQERPVRKAVPDALDLDPAETEAVDLATPEHTYSEGQSAAEARTPLTTERLGADLAEASPQPNFLPNAPEPASLKSTHFYSPERRFTIRKERHHGEDTRLAPPQLAIPPERQEWLLKKMRKLTDHFVLPAQSDSQFVWEKDEATYEISVRHQKAASASSFDKLEMEVRTERYGRTLSTTVQMQRVGFSQFAQFIDFWNPYVMVHDDEFDGRFHTNSAFKLSSSRGVHPKFEGKVTTAGYEIHQSAPFGYASHDSIFQGGLETGAAEIKFPRDLYSLIKNSATDSTLLKLQGESWVHFNRDGTVSWRTHGEPPQQGRLRLPDAPFTILGESKEKLHLEGTLLGKVLIYNRGTVEITGNLIYAKAPEIFDDADDFLGIVSEKNIEIAKPEKTGADDLYIYAAMLAKRTFKVRDFFRPIHKKLFIYGSLTAGTLTATEPRYATRIRFDKRLRTRRPPNFPMTDRYELDNWDGRWDVELQQ